MRHATVYSMQGLLVAAATSFVMWAIRPLAVPFAGFVLGPVCKGVLGESDPPHAVAQVYDLKFIVVAGLLAALVYIAMRIDDDMIIKRLAKSRSSRDRA